MANAYDMQTTCKYMFLTCMSAANYNLNNAISQSRKVCVGLLPVVACFASVPVCYELRYRTGYAVHRL